MVAIYFIIGYLMGNIQTAYLLGRYFKKEDIRSRGHGNSGATNAVLSYGWKYGVVVALVDILKACIAISICNYLSGKYLPVEDYTLHLCGLAVFLGHCYPMFMDFKGGKGTATLVGIMISMGVLPGISGVAILIVATVATGYIVVGTLLLNILFIFFTVYLGYSNISIALSIILVLFSISYHIENYKRIYKGEEKNLSNALNKERTGDNNERGL